MGYDVCLRRIRRGQSRSIRELGAWDEPTATNQQSGLAPAAERKMEGGKIKPAKDVWDRDEVESNLRYKEMGTSVPNYIYPVSNVSIFGHLYWIHTTRVYG